MKKLCLLLAVLLALSLCACRGQETDEEEAPLSVDQALEEALEALTNGACEKACMIGADGSLTFPQNTGLAAILSSYSTYEIGQVKADGDKATATVTITAPDSVTILKQVMEVSDDPASEEFAQKLTEILENDPPMLDFTVEVQLQQTQEGWGIVPSFELSNALSGGLAEEYQKLYEGLMDGMLEGGEQ